MNVLACLLIGSLAVAVLAPRILPPLTRSGRAPRLAATVWGLAIGSVAAMWLAAPLWLALDLLAVSSSFTRTCMAILRTVFGRRDGLAAQVLLVGVALSLAVWVTGQIAVGYRAAHRRARRHVEGARIVGRRLPGLDAYVLDSEHNAAYCLPGRHRTIVLSTATIAVLSPIQLAAVLAHERAHLAGHHHLLVRLSQGLHTALPRIRLFATGSVEIARLLEMCADDAAARRHGRTAVIGAIAALAGSPLAPTGALAAAGPTAAARSARLLAPDNRAAVMLTRVTLSVTAVLLLLGPVSTVLLAGHGVSLCPILSA